MDIATSPIARSVFFAALVSVGAVGARQLLDPSFRTPAEVAAELNIPVLAAVPQSAPGRNGNGRNGNGRGNGLNQGQDYSLDSDQELDSDHDLTSPLSKVGRA